MVRISRRNLIGLLSGGALVAACSENAATMRRQFVLVSEDELAALGEEAWRDALSQLPRVDNRRMEERLARIGERVVGPC